MNTQTAPPHYIRRTVQTHRYVVVPNAAVQDQRLSLRARGLLVFILSLPPDTRLTSERLCSMTPEGRDAVRTAMRELRDLGYAKLQRRRDQAGTFWSWTEVTDTPGNFSDTDPGNPPESSPEQVFPQVEPETANQDRGDQAAKEKVRRVSTGEPKQVVGRRKRQPTRIPDDFAPSPESVAAVQRVRPDVDWRAETNRFVTYWRAQPGKKGEKADWQLTWRNWMKRARAQTNGVVEGPGTYSPYKSDW